MEIILAPDVYVNASVALGSPPEAVIKRVLGGEKKAKTSGWILDRVEGMFHSIPQFKQDHVDDQMKLIRGLVEVVDDPSEHEPTAWEEALVAAAKKAGIERVVTDHPDLLEMESSDGIEFLSTEAWLLEVTTPPPAPPVGDK